MDGATTKGSEQWTAVLQEFLRVVIHAVLYTRNIYPRAIFQSFKNYQIPVQMCTHPGVQSYIDSALDEVKSILDVGGRVQQIYIRIKDSDNKLLEQFVFDVQHQLNYELEFEELLSLEQSFRALLLKVFCCDTQLSPLPEDCSWSVDIQTSRSTFLELQEKQLVNDVMWIEAADRMSASEGACKIVPITYINSSPLKVQLYIQDMKDWHRFIIYRDILSYLKQLQSFLYMFNINTKVTF